METKVFDRVEKKYLITAKEKTQLLKSINEHMVKDNYHESEILNLYFDNDNYDLIIQSIDHPEFKEKLRARSYGGYDRVFLEIKTKIKGPDANIGYKRRVMSTHADFNEFLLGKADIVTLAARSVENNNDLQIAKEADYLINHFGLKPKILITYNRESYKGEDDLRITFDKNLKYRCKNLSFTSKKRDKIYFKDKRNIIMEVKANGVMPLWLVKVLSEAKIYPQQFSKIGKIYEKLRKDKNV